MSCVLRRIGRRVRRFLFCSQEPRAEVVLPVELREASHRLTNEAVKVQVAAAKLKTQADAFVALATVLKEGIEKNEAR